MGLGAEELDLVIVVVGLGWDVGDISMFVFVYMF